MSLACCMVLSPSNSYRWMSQTYCISIKYVLYCWSNVGFNQLLYLCNLRRAQGQATKSPQNATDNLYLLYHYHIESLLELPDPKTYKCHSLVQRYHDHTNVIIISPIRLISQNLRHQERVSSLLCLCLACLKHSLKIPAFLRFPTRRCCYSVVVTQDTINYAFMVGASGTDL